MSQVTEQSVRFQTALASIKLIQASAVLDLTEDDFDFLTSNKVWIDTLFLLNRSSDLNLFNNLIQRNQSAAFSSGKVRPNHETNINIIARRTGKDVNSHTVLDGII